MYVYNYMYGCVYSYIGVEMYMGLYVHMHLCVGGVCVLISDCD